MLAHLKNDIDRVEQLVEEISAGKRARFGAALKWLADRLTNECGACCEFAPHGDRDRITYWSMSPQWAAAACSRRPPVVVRPRHGDGAVAGADRASR